MKDLYVPDIAVIKETIEEYGMTYNYENSFINAYLSHFRLLRNNGIPQIAHD